jgi:hypothetical protein
MIPRKVIVAVVVFLACIVGAVMVIDALMPFVPRPLFHQIGYKGVKVWVPNGRQLDTNRNIAFYDPDLDILVIITTQAQIGGYRVHGSVTTKDRRPTGRVHVSARGAGIVAELVCDKSTIVVVEEQAVTVFPRSNAPVWEFTTRTWETIPSVYDAILDYPDEKWTGDDLRRRFSKPKDEADESE